MASKFKKFYLYRVKFIRDHQKNLLDDGATPEEIFTEAILEKPSVKLNKGGEWKLANVEKIGINGGIFVVGRITQKNTDKYDYLVDEFVETKDEQGPFASIYFDSKLGVVAIEDKSKVNSKIEATARRLNDLLDESNAVKNRMIKCQVDEIRDPENFITKIKESIRVLSLKSTFTGPNPTDADEYFQRPLEVYADKSKADRGVIQIFGSNLDKGVVVAVARTNAATGNDASARIEKKDGEFDSIPLKKIKCSFLSPINDGKVNIFNSMHIRYEQVRYEGNDN